MQRPNEWNPILKGGLLFRQYLVDNAATIDSERLSFQRRYQYSLRSMSYSRLTDALNNDNLKHIGCRFILSSHFVGGPRFMRERCKDKLMYVRKYGSRIYQEDMRINGKSH